MVDYSRFMESEVELHTCINEMHVIATVPDLYHVLTDLNAVQSLLQLLPASACSIRRMPWSDA